MKVTDKSLGKPPKILSLIEPITEEVMIKYK